MTLHSDRKYEQNSREHYLLHSVAWWPALWRSFEMLLHHWVSGLARQTLHANTNAQMLLFAVGLMWDGIIAPVKYLGWCLNQRDYHLQVLCFLFILLVLRIKYIRNSVNPIKFVFLNYNKTYNHYFLLWICISNVLVFFFG